MIFPKQYLAYVKAHREIVISGILSLIAYIYLALFSRAYAELTLLQMWAVCFPCALLSFYIFWHYAKNSDKIFPTFLMLGFAILFRLSGINTFPILEDDFYRFLWDGQMTAVWGTPYGQIPADFLGDLNINAHFEDILGSINHPDIATIYGPVLQGIFALSYLIAPGEIWPLQSILALFDIGIILLLLRLSKAYYVLLYAWSPLIIKEFSISAHPDVVGAFFIVLAFYIYTNKTTSKQWLWLPACLALATGVKVFALVLTPLLLRFQWRAWAVYSATLVLLALPFALHSNEASTLSGLQSVWFPDGLKAMANDWLFNAPLYSLAQFIMPLATAKIILLGAFASIACAYFFYVYLNRQHLPIRIDRLFGVFFLCIPVFNPWYLVWLLPFATIYFSFWAWAASVAVFLAYASGINFVDSTLALYQQPSWIIALEFSLISLALIADLLNKKTRAY